MRDGDTVPLFLVVLPVLLTAAAGFLIFGRDVLVAPLLPVAGLATAVLTVLALLVLVRPTDEMFPEVTLPVPVLLPVTDFLEPYQTSLPPPAIWCDG